MSKMRRTWQSKKYVHNKASRSDCVPFSHASLSTSVFGFDPLMIQPRLGKYSWLHALEKSTNKSIANLALICIWKYHRIFDKTSHTSLCWRYAPFSPSSSSSLSLSQFSLRPTSPSLSISNTRKISLSAHLHPSTGSCPGITRARK